MLKNRENILAALDGWAFFLRRLAELEPELVSDLRLVPPIYIADLKNKLDACES